MNISDFLNNDAVKSSGKFFAKTLPVSGALLGAYTQDPFSEDSSLLGTAVAASMAGYAAYSIRDDVSETFGSMIPKRLTADSLTRKRIDVSRANDNSLKMANDSLSDHLSRINYIDDTSIKDNRYLAKNLNTILGNRFSPDAQLDITMVEIEDYVSSISNDRSKVMQLRDIVKNKGEISEVTGSMINSKSDNFVPIRATDNIEGIEKKLYNHFKDNLGNSNEQALSKSKEMAPALQGKTVNISDTNMVIKGPSGSKDAVFNLTASRDGVNYTKKNGITSLVRSVNTLGGLYNNDMNLVTNMNSASESSSIGIREVFKKNHPESLIGLMHSVNGKTDHEGLLSLSDQINSKTIYSALDSRNSSVSTVYGNDFSEYAKRVSGTIDYSLSLKYDNEGVGRLAKTNLTIDKGEARSEMSQIFNKMALETGKDPKVNQGTSALTLATAPEDADRIYTPGLFNAEDRAATSVNIRDHLPVNKSTSEYLTKVGGLRKDNNVIDSVKIDNLRESAAHGTRIQVSEKMADMFPKEFGNKFSIDDGHGIYNQNKEFKVSSKGMTSVTIGNIGDKTNPKYLLSSGIPEIVATGTEKEIFDYLQKNPVEVSSGKILGYGKNNEAAKLPGHFTSGKLKSVVRTEKGLDLEFIGQNDPKDWFKGFGVTTKAGFTKADTQKFAEMGALALAESRGDLSLRKNRKGDYKVSMTNSSIFSDKKRNKDTTYKVSEVLDRMRGTKKGKALLAEATNTTIMQRWADVGQEGIETILMGDKEANNSLLKELDSSLKGKNADSLLNRMKTLGLTSGNKTESATVYRTILATSGGKASQDMFLSLTEHAARSRNAKDLEFLIGLENKGVNFSGEEMTKLESIMSKTFKKLEGTSYTEMTPGLGEAIHGAGKGGSVSWLEYAMLKSTGFDSDILDSMTELNRGALQELSMVESVTRKGNFGANSFMEGTDRSKVMSDVFKVNAEERRTFLSEQGVRVSSNNTMANYTLANDIGSIKSIPIGFEDTNYTGLKEYGGREMLFQVEKNRSAVISADIRMSEATTVAAKESARENLLSQMKELGAIQGKMMSGDNNLTKEAAKRVAKDSLILTARPIGGTADGMVTKKVNGVNKRIAEDVLYVSEDTARKMYQRQGLELDDYMVQKGNRKGIYDLTTAGGHNLYAQVSREPVQGPFSSMGFQIRVDKSLSGTGDHLFIPKSNELLNKFAFLDYDADHLRMLPLFSLSNKQTDRYIKRNKVMMDNARDLLGMQDKLGVKGVSKHLDVLSQFENMKDKVFSMFGRKEMTGLRKVDSPEVTRIVSEMNKALDIEGAGKELFLKERVIAHNLTENLIKSQHKASGEGHRGAVQELVDAQQKLLSAGGKKSDFRASLNRIINDTLGGQVDKMNPTEKKMYEGAVSKLSEVFSQRYGDINEAMQTFLGPKGYKDMSSVDVQSAIIEHGGMQGGEGPIPSKTESRKFTKSGVSKAYNDISSDIGSLLRKNKAILVGATLGLGAVAIATRDTPSQLSSTSPLAPQQEPLQPLPDKKGYIRQYNPNDNLSVVASVQTPSNNLNRMTLDKALFGDNNSVSVNITDKSGMF
ncbi:hypothetical protein N9242_00940 [Vicingaceae bacterium]|nr:hypothetical protein [Vicingaceae bacterium]